MIFFMLWFCEDAALAQLVEHIIRNDGVVGSNPIGGTTKPFSLDHEWNVVCPITRYDLIFGTEI